MKFKAHAAGNKGAGQTLALISTRNVTLLNSPEFGVMLVDAKCADGKIIDSGRLQLTIEIAARPGLFSKPMMYDPADFKMDSFFFLTHAQFFMHDALVASYTCRFNASNGIYTYDIKLPDSNNHPSGILTAQIKQLIEALRP